MEIWDAYDSEYNIIDDMTLIRGEESSIPDGVYHLVCHVLVKHTDGSYLLMQRDPRKPYPSMWEATAGGSALKGESPIECAIRELREETGIAATKLEEIRRFVWDPTRCFYVEYLCITDCNKDSVVLQEGETVAYKWATADEISLMKSDEMLSEWMRRYISIHSGKMKLVFPSIEYKDKAIDYVREFNEYGSDINGSGSLDDYLKESTYEKWLEKVLSYIDIANLPEPKVPDLTYFYVRKEDDRIVGMINIRLALNDFLRNEGGHIGYSVRPTERRKNYATDMLMLALKVCGRVGIKEVLVSCDKENPASAGVIRKCDGILKREFYSETFGETIRMYGIKI